MKYALVLNDMRSSNVENIISVKFSKDKQELIDWYNNKLCKPYRDENWGKTFKKGSELEWFNAGDIEKENSYWGGIYTFNDDAPDEYLANFALIK